MQLNTHLGRRMGFMHLNGEWLMGYCANNFCLINSSLSTGENKVQLTLCNAHYDWLTGHWTWRRGQAFADILINMRCLGFTTITTHTHTHIHCNSNRKPLYYALNRLVKQEGFFITVSTDRQLTIIMNYINHHSLYIFFCPQALGWASMVHHHTNYTSGNWIYFQHELYNFSFDIWIVPPTHALAMKRRRNFNNRTTSSHVIGVEN